MGKVEINRMNGESYEITEVDERMLPMIIKTELVSLTELENAVKKAKEKALDLKKNADNMQSPTWGKKKAAIEDSQNMITALAVAQEAATEAQNLSFIFQKKLAEASRYLFGLGVSNMASNRTVVRQLKETLEGKDAGDIDDLVAQEISNVIDQLLIQEDIMRKQEKLADRQDEIEEDQEGLCEIIENLDSNMSEVALNVAQISNKINEIDGELEKGNKKDVEQDNYLREVIKNDQEQDKKIEKGENKDREQDAEIRKQADITEKHEKLFEEKKLKDNNQDQEIIRQAQKDKEHDDRLAKCEEKYDEYDNEIDILKKNNIEYERIISELEQKLDVIRGDFVNKYSHFESSIGIMENEMIEKIETKAGKSTSIIAFVISISAFILAILQFFIR